MRMWCRSWGLFNNNIVCDQEIKWYCLSGFLHILFGQFLDLSYNDFLFVNRTLVWMGMQLICSTNTWGTTSHNPIRTRCGRFNRHELLIKTSKPPIIRTLIRTWCHRAILPLITSKCRYQLHFHLNSSYYASTWNQSYIKVPFKFLNLMFLPLRNSHAIDRVYKKGL